MKGAKKHTKKISLKKVVPLNESKEESLRSFRDLLQAHNEGLDKNLVITTKSPSKLSKVPSDTVSATEPYEFDPSYRKNPSQKSFGSLGET